MKRDSFAEKAIMQKLKCKLPRLEKAIRYRDTGGEDALLMRYRTENGVFYANIWKMRDPSMSMAELAADEAKRLETSMAPYMDERSKVWENICHEIEYQFRNKYRMEAESLEELDFKISDSIAWALMTRGQSWRGALEILEVIGARETYKMVKEEGHVAGDVVYARWVVGKKDYTPKWAD